MDLGVSSNPERVDGLTSPDAPPPWDAWPPLAPSSLAASEPLVKVPSGLRSAPPLVLVPVLDCSNVSNGYFKPGEREVNSYVLMSTAAAMRSMTALSCDLAKLVFGQVRKVGGV
jgi:hypothetical protein